MCVPSKSLQLSQTVCDPMDCSPPGSSIHGTFQARILKWVTISLDPLKWVQGNFPSQGLNLPLFHLRHRVWILYHRATWKASDFHTRKIKKKKKGKVNGLHTLGQNLLFHNLWVSHQEKLSFSNHQFPGLCNWEHNTEHRKFLGGSQIVYLSQSVHSLSHVQLFATPWTAAHHASLSITNSRSLLKLMSIKSVMPSNYLILCHPLLFLSSILPSIGSFPMSQFFASGGQSIGVSASASVLPVNFQDWFLLGWTGLISVLSKGLSRVFSITTVSIFRCSAFFIVQLLHPYMTTGKTIGLTRWTFVGKVMSLVFNMLLGWS